MPTRLRKAAVPYLLLLPGLGWLLLFFAVPLGIMFLESLKTGTIDTGFTLTSARSSADAYSYEPASGKLTRWTESEMGGLDPASFVVPEHLDLPMDFASIQKAGRSTTWHGRSLS